MAEKEEGPIVDNETGSLKVKEKIKKQPDGNETKGNVTKVKAKMKKPAEVLEETVTKVDLSKPSKPEENETKKDNADDSGVVAESKDADAPQEQKEIQPEAETQETPVLEEVANEEQVEELETKVTDAIVEATETGIELPENIQKVVDFINDTGGDLNDYVKLNQDYSKLDDQDLLYEYYKNTKPHLNAEEINFLMEDQFSYNEEEDDEREIRRKKLALKEQVANAKSHLDGQKSKYYEEVKAGSRLTPEQQKAINFFNRYNKESEENKKIADKQTNTFKLKTQQVFNDKFKGFEYNVGDKKYRFNVKNAGEVKETQSDINNFVKKFLNENNEMSDAKGYHKSLFTAMNPDAIAKHFYDQGKADAMKESVAKAKNVSMDPRQAFSNDNTSGPKVRVLNDDTSPTFKFKIKNK